MAFRLQGLGAALAGSLLCSLAANAGAGDCPPGGALAAAGAVASVGEAGTLMLDDGQAVRLSTIAVPAAESPHGEEARAVLEGLVLGRAVMLADVGKQDRYARLPAQVLVGEGEGRVWVQERLVAKGLAQVRSLKHERACASELIRHENAARRAKRGLWASTHFSVRAAAEPEALRRFLGTFQIVEGEVVSTGASGGKVYLNFGHRWKTDFTCVIAARDLDMFAAAGIRPLRLPQQRVRLRGWLSEHDGPMMVLDHPEQIELIEDGDSED